MLRTLLIAILLASAPAARAQSIEGGGPIDDGPRLRMFISPAGEPFRGGNGLERWFAGADADRDGKLTPDEFQADALRFFQVLDADHDGRLDGFETSDYERELVPEITGVFFDGLPDGGSDGVGAPGRRRSMFGRGRGVVGAARIGAGRFGLLDIPQPVTGADREHDGKVTLDEWKKSAAIRFSMLDPAKAGVLTRETLPSLPGTAMPGKKPPKRRPRSRG